MGETTSRRPGLTRGSGCGKPQSRVIQIGGVRFLRRDHRLLMDQPASGIKRVGDPAVEDSQLQSLKQHFDTVTHAGGLDAYRLKGAFKPASSLRMITWKIEELIKSSPPAAFAGSCPVLGRSISDDGASLQTDSA